jgi:hypothetical protein
MADARKPNPKFTSPRGDFKYPKLDKPDYGTKDYPCPEGKYEVRLVLKAEDPATKQFIAALNPIYNEAIADAEAKFKELKVETRKKLKQVTVNDLFTTLYDKETEQPTGFIEFKFKMAASGVANKGKDNERKWTSLPAVFDAKGTLIKKVPEIWSGSTGKISFEAQPYFIPGTAAAGLSLKLKAAQLIELRQGGSRDASDYGFGAEDDGYEYNSEAGAEGFGDETGAGGAGYSAPEGNIDLDDEIPF